MAGASDVHAKVNNSTQIGTQRSSMERTPSNPVPRVRQGHAQPKRDPAPRVRPMRGGVVAGLVKVPVRPQVEES